MKILYLCTFYHRAMLFNQQITQLRKKGYDIKVFNSAKKNEGIAPKFTKIMEDENVKHVECWNSLDRILFFPRQLKIERQMKKCYDIKSFDLIHAHLFLSSGYSALRMKKKYGTKYVVSVRVTDLTGFIKLPIFRKLAVRIAREASGIVFLSNTHKREFFEKIIPENYRKEIEQKSKVIGNCIESYWQENSVNEAKKIDKNNVKLIAVAKIRAVKNLEMVSKANEILNKKGISSKLTIVGEVQEKSIYDNLCKYKNTEIKPFMAKEELKEVFSKNDIFVLPSKNETFGRAYVEAMTQGLPVIYTRGQGFDGFFEEGKIGFSVDSENVEELVERIIDIINNYEDISNNCIKLCCNFYEDNIIDKLDKFYSEI